MLLQTNDSSSELETPRIYSIFGSRLGLLQMRDCKGFGEDYEHDFCKEACPEVWQGKPKVGVA